VASTSEHDHARRAAEPARSVATKRVTWAELFFDVVFVFVITQVTELLRTDPSAKGLLRALVVFVPVYWAWVGVSVYADTHDVDALVDRLGLFVVGMASLFMFRRGVVVGSIPRHPARGRPGLDPCHRLRPCRGACTCGRRRAVVAVRHSRRDHDA